MNMLGMCFNWKVLAGLAAVGVGIVLVAPQLALAALPVLVLAACPLSMLLMMRGMGSMAGGTCSTDTRPADRTAAARTREEQIADLRTQLTGLQAQQETIAREMARLEGPSAPAVREAEAVARAAGESVQASPVDLLQERYVRGEIGIEEYEAALDRLLAGPRLPAGHGSPRMS